MSSCADDCAEEILSTSLETLYGYQAVTYSSPGSIFTFKHPSGADVILKTPDTHAHNWNLHASDIWVASVFLAQHLEDLHLESYPATPVRVLELGAGAGLPGITIAKVYQNTMVTLSDYSDEILIQTLTENVARNDVSPRCRALPFCWGSDPSSLLSSGPDDVGKADNQGFDVVLAADTLWNRETHIIFLRTLKDTLRKTHSARIHLVAGFHTGRFTLQAFLNAVTQEESQLDVELSEEVDVKQGGRRPWDVNRADGEDEQERRRWLLWIVLKWRPSALSET